MTSSAGSICDAIPSGFDELVEHDFDEERPIVSAVMVKTDHIHVVVNFGYIFPKPTVSTND